MTARPREQGVAAVEFALLCVLFFTLVMAAIELARVMFVINTLYEVTRHAASAAAFTSHRDADSLDTIRQRAVLRNTPGDLILAAPVSDQSVRITYLALPRAQDGSMTIEDIPATSLPASPRQNREICMADPNASNCIRFVKASICDARNAAACRHILYRPFLPLISLPLPLPKATTISTVESFGYLP